MKACQVCGEKKQVDQFHLRSRRCKPCARDRAKAIREGRADPRVDPREIEKI